MVSFVKNTFNAAMVEFIVKVMICAFVHRGNFGMGLFVCNHPIVVVDKSGIVKNFTVSVQLIFILMGKNVWCVWTENNGIRQLKNVHAVQDRNGMVICVWFLKVVIMAWCGTKILSHVNVQAQQFGTEISASWTHVQGDKFGITLWNSVSVLEIKCW